MIRRDSLLLVISIIALSGCDDSEMSDSARTKCLAGPYPLQTASPYLLPYEPGQSFCVGQGNCSEGSHAPETLVEYAYDFLMPVGTNVIAAREGRVLLVEERFEDGTRISGQENFVNILHSDGSIAGYVHLTRNGSLVDVNDVVNQGQLIALSGDSGNSSEPHLHFHVQACDGCGTAPLTFRNTRPHPNGLLQGECYTAEP